VLLSVEVRFDSGIKFFEEVLKKKQNAFLTQRNLNASAGLIREKHSEPQLL
jgi:hypothetical protein